MVSQEKPPIRIGFCGSSGTGKSTLAKALASRYGLLLNPVGSRSIAQAMGFESPYDVDRAGKRFEFQERLLVEKIRWEAEHEAFVSDRTPFDNLAYTLLHAVDSVDEAFLESCYLAMNRYTHVFHCPIESFHYVGLDPARRSSKTYQRIYQAVLRGLLGEWTARDDGFEGGGIWVQKSDRVERLEEVLSWIEA